MKNTTFKRRALISSICMLLVALVALGSATFAWFSTNTTAKASNLTVKTTAAEGLVISTDNKANWGHDQAYGVNSATLSPVSFDLDDTPTTIPQGWVYTASDENTYAALDSALPTAAAISDYWTQDIYVKLTGGSTTSKKDVNLGFTLTSGDDNTETEALRSAIRIVCTYKADSSSQEDILGIWAKAANSVNFVPSTTTASTTYSSMTPGTATAVAYGVGASAAGTTKKISDVDTTGNNLVKMYVYLEGQDANTKTSNVKVDLSAIYSQIQANFSIAA